AEDGIRDPLVTGVQTCALPISPGLDGEGDRRVQAYNFRLCATDRPENRRPWPKPANYDEKQYELLLRNFEAGDHRTPWAPILMRSEERRVGKGRRTARSPGQRT